MTTVLEQPAQIGLSAAQRLRTQTAAARISFNWFGTRKSLSGDQKAQGDSPNGHEEGSSQDQGNDATSPCAEGRTDSDLGASLRDVEGQHAVQPPASHDEGKSAEHGEHRSPERPGAELGIHVLA